MNKKAGKTGENPENEEVDLTEDFEEITGKRAELSLSYIDRVQEFITRNELEDLETIFYLYKYDNSTAGKSRAFIAKYTEVDPPDEDQIGKKFGSGRYLVVMVVPKSSKAPEGFMRAYNLKIHQFYDTLNTPTVQSPTIVQQPQNNLSDTINVISQLMAAFAPFFNMMQQNKQQNSPDLSAILFKTFENTSEVLQKNMLENVKVNADLQRKLIQIEKGGNQMNAEIEEDEEEEVSLLETLKPLLMEYLPTLLGNNAQSKALQTVVKNTPQFKTIVNNKKEFKTLVAFLDKEKGVETTNKILANLKLKRV